MIFVLKKKSQVSKHSTNIKKSDNNFLPSSLVFIEEVRHFEQIFQSPHNHIYPNTVPECSNEYKDYTYRSKHALSYPDTFLAINFSYGTLKSRQ